MKRLSVILLYSPLSEVRGKLRRYYYEVKANVFVGTVSSKVRELVWEGIVKTKTQACMITQTSSEQGFDFITTQSDCNFEDFDGIKLPTHFL